MWYSAVRAVALRGGGVLCNKDEAFCYERSPCHCCGGSGLYWQRKKRTRVPCVVCMGHGDINLLMNFAVKDALDNCASKEGGRIVIGATYISVYMKGSDSNAA